jgi:iron complex outermembrane receptor protein
MNSRALFASTALAPFFLLPGIAVAQTPAAGPETEQREDVIVVTAPGGARALSDVLQPLTVIDQDAILDGLNGGLGETLAGLAGVSSSSFGPGASRPVIRGLGAGRVRVLTNGIGVIDASSASPDHAVLADGLDAQRIEILRGPAALGYGGAAIGGVVNVIDNLIAETLPDTAFSGQGLVSATSVDEGIEADAGLSFATGPLVFRLEASRRDADDFEIPGYAESARLRAMEEAEHDDHDDDHDHEDDDHDEEEMFGTLENSFVETDTLAGGVSYIGPQGFIGMAVKRTTSAYGLPGHSHAHDDEHEEAHDEDDDDHGDEEENPFIDMEQTRIDLRGGLTLSTGVLTRLSGNVAFADYTHTEFEAPGEPGTVFTSEGWEARIVLDHAAFGEEGQIGLQASDVDFAAAGDEAFITPTTTRQTGVFAIQHFHAGDLTLELGGRIDSVRVDNVFAGERDFTPISLSAGLQRDFGNGLSGAITLTRSERAPSDVELFADGPHLATETFEIGDDRLGKEAGVGLDLVLRGQIDGLGLPVRFEAALFHNAFEDFIYLNPTGAEEDGLPVFAYTQADASLTGGEAQVSVELGQALGVIWSADVTAEWVRGKLDAGGNLPFMPPFGGTLALSGERGPFSGRIAYDWAAEQDKVAGFELPTDSYGLWGVRLGYDLTSDGRIGLIVEGRNLTDEEARNHVSTLKDKVPFAGRSLRIALKARF